MPSGEPLSDAIVQLHLDAADTLEKSLVDLRGHEGVVAKIDSSGGRTPAILNS
ncbi:hypothetical protein BSU04_07400 [Caballeronia sordidicola]|uniref:Uncharacterized protein n=1 Tax=Caballeronia sordidicola TaxID=196367 RepID=A0A226X793_CABSO|nr:hypothetical protein BSU04_07400 [Caballeronia sordidicola]